MCLIVIMKNEQIDFNSYVFKKYYQPKATTEVKDKDKGSPNNNKDNVIKARPKGAHLVKEMKFSGDSVIDKVKDRVDNCTIGKPSGNSNDEKDNDINKRIIDEINNELTKNIVEQKKNRQEEYNKVLDEQNKLNEGEKENEKPIEDMSLNKPINPITNNLLQSNHNHNHQQLKLQSNDFNDAYSKPKEAFEYIDDFDLLKIEKAKERQKRIEYSKVLQEQIEEQKRYKAEQQLKSHTNDKEESKPLYQYHCDHPESKLRTMYPSNIGLSSNQPIPQCKTRHETQQFISTYANLLSNFCDSKMEQYQNTQMLFKPYEKMLNEMVDGKISQLTSDQSPFMLQNKETIYNINPTNNNNEHKIEKESIEEKDNGSLWHISLIENNKNSQVNLKRSNANANGKTSLKKSHQRATIDQQRSAIINKEKGRLIQTAEARNKNNNRKNYNNKPNSNSHSTSKTVKSIKPKPKPKPIVQIKQYNNNKLLKNSQTQTNGKQKNRNR